MRRSDQYPDPIRHDLEASERSLEEESTYDTARTVNSEDAPHPRSPWDLLALREAVRHHGAALFRLEPRYKTLSVRVEASRVRIARLERRHQTTARIAAALAVVEAVHVICHLLSWWTS